MNEHYKEGYREGFADGYKAGMDHNKRVFKIGDVVSTPPSKPFETMMTNTNMCTVCGRNLNYMYSTGSVCTSLNCPRNGYSIVSLGGTGGSYT